MLTRLNGGTQGADTFVAALTPAPSQRARCRAARPLVSSEMRFAAQGSRVQSQRDRLTGRGEDDAENRLDVVRRAGIGPMTTPRLRLVRRGARLDVRSISPGPGPGSEVRSPVAERLGSRFVLRHIVPEAVLDGEGKARISVHNIAGLLENAAALANRQAGLQGSHLTVEDAASTIRASCLISRCWTIP